jgi:hypothetical protein
LSLAALLAGINLIAIRISASVRAEQMASAEPWRLAGLAAICCFSPVKAEGRRSSAGRFRPGLFTLGALYLYLDARLSTGLSDKKQMSFSTQRQSNISLNIA